MYTPGQVWSVLVGESVDIDENVDVRSAMERLPEQQRLYLMLLAYGYPAHYAEKHTGLHGNQTRVKRDALNRLTRLVNGDEDGEEVCANKQRPTVRQKHPG